MTGNFGKLISSALNITVKEWFRSSRTVVLVLSSAADAAAVAAWAKAGSWRNVTASRQDGEYIVTFW